MTQVPSNALAPYLYADEAQIVDELLDALPWDEARAARVQAQAASIVERLRGAKRKSGELENFLRQYGLNTEEGLALMTLAEALLRIPDAHTANLLIRDKMKAADWLAGVGGGDILVKAAGFGLSLTRKTLDSAVSRLGEPVIRKAMVEAMRMMGKQFVMGRTISEAMKNARDYEKKGYSLSYDMLGEGARTLDAAARYFESYKNALVEIAAHKNESAQRPNMSVKLSALHPRYDARHEAMCVPVMSARLLELAQMAAQRNIALTVDAEEVDRLELSLRIIENVAADPSLSGWDGFGLAIQAYSKRCLPLIARLAALAERTGRILQVRLVKGAYWDTEIKRAQIMGLSDYPVFTRKANTDLAYLACARALLERRDVFYPMFATHNAHSVAAIMELAGNRRGGFEFQRLHGMGETLHDLVLSDGLAGVRIYAPCGSHEDLLPYLVRRLLENGASTSFVHKILDPDTPVAEIVADPVVDARNHPGKRHARIPLPRDIYGPARANAAGMDLTEPSVLNPLLHRMRTAKLPDRASAYLNGAPLQSAGAIPVQDMPVFNPANLDMRIGTASCPAPHDAFVNEAFARARQGFKIWNATPSDDRARALEQFADLMEKNSEALMALCVREAGKTVDDALAEIREAVDFCRYYAVRGRRDFTSEGTRLPGPTGERNILTLHGRGIFVCISPWNFPLAIFVGQIAAALMAGNAVIAKPAEQTPLVAAMAVDLMYKAGVEPDALILAPGDGAMGAALVAHENVAGVAFTGSTDVARLINRALAAKDGPIVPLIAETGGQNAMIVDSSALLEQVVDDVMISAFGSTGQRCSALRVLYVQDDIADAFMAMLAGAMQIRRVGDPIDPETDFGPVIDRDALENLRAHCEKMDRIARKIAAVPMEENLADQGTYFAPTAYEINDISGIGAEVFGPILHIIRFKAEAIDEVIDAINETGYGLTAGLHSRISTTMAHVTNRLDVGNAYINRTMIGAVVGVQPFGGRGLSGTGPKAGGPHYLQRFATEKVVSTDTTRQGGNASLVTLEE